MLNIGIYFETSKGSGGAHHQNLKLLDIFNVYLSKEFNFTYIVTNLELKKELLKKDLNVIFFKKNLRFRIEQFLFRFSFFKEVYKKFSANSSFENFLIIKDFDLIFFNSPYEVSLLLNRLNFVIMLLSLQHQQLCFFPEYKLGHDNDIRDKIIENSVKKSFKIYIGSTKDKDLLMKYFNANANKIIVQPYAFNLPSIFQENNDYNYEKKFRGLNLPANKDIFIYPAQFWSHKNHKYVVDVALKLKRENIKDIFFVFCGFEKGNLKYIQKIINENYLSEYIKIFSYIDDYELISLYLNCFGIIMPTLVGPTTIPMYEAFYFKKNIFFTKDLSDNSVRDFIDEIDINDINSFTKKYYEVKNNKSKNQEKLTNAKIFIDKYCSDTLIANNFRMTFKEYEYFKSLWS